MLARVVTTDGGRDGTARVGHSQSVRVTVTHCDRLTYRSSISIM